MKHISIFLLLSSTCCFSQIEYHFDYALEYETTFHQDSISQTRILLTNSKDNSYFVTLIESDSLTFELVLNHHDKLFANFEVLKSELYKAEFVNIDCKSVFSAKNQYKYQTKNYDFHILEDTLVNDTVYYAYKLESHEKPKRKIRNGIGTNYYIIDKATAFHLPILQHATAYEEWKLNKSIPNGIFTELTFIDPKNDIQSTQKLKSYLAIDKKFIIEKDCNYKVEIKISQ